MRFFQGLPVCMFESNIRQSFFLLRLTILKDNNITARTDSSSVLLPLKSEVTEGYLKTNGWRHELENWHLKYMFYM